MRTNIEINDVLMEEFLIRLSLKPRKKWWIKHYMNSFKKLNYMS
jgi:hypothetical protein